MANVTSAPVRQHLMALSEQPRRPLEELFPSVDPSAISLISSLLEFDPAKRLSALEALENLFFKKLYEPGKEVTAPPIPREELAFNGPKLNAAQMRWLFQEEAALYHAEPAEELARGGGGGGGGGGHRNS
eukprot:contig_31763_g7741